MVRLTAWSTERGRITDGPGRARARGSRLTCAADAEQPPAQASLVLQVCLRRQGPWSDVVFCVLAGRSPHAVGDLAVGGVPHVVMRLHVLDQLAQREHPRAVADDVRMA